LKKTSILFFFCFSFLGFSQKKYPSNYFRKPLDIPIILAGTFGELRSNHFHAGLDIKTQRKTGLKVYAAAEGYISRIKVSLWGYGKVIYITHPNGYTTVYAHLSKFGKGIESYVKKVQYKKERYETGNIYPKSNELKIKKGQIIAYSGATGGYVAPHLHFEIRDTKTENIINPMFFGITSSDSIPPIFSTLMAYPLTKNSRINQSNIKTSIPIKKIGRNSYKADMVSANDLIGFGVKVFDRLNKAPNKNGIYSLEMLVNGKRVYYHDLETFSFAKSKYINLFIDYPQYIKYKRHIQKTYKADRNLLNFYKNLVNNGKIFIKNGQNYTIKIIAKDFNGNKSSITLPIKGTKSNTIFNAVKDTTAYKIVAKNFQKFTLEKVTVAFPKNTFYNDFYLDFKVKNKIAYIHKPIVPLDKKYTLSFDVSNYTNQEKKYLYIANINNKKYPRYQNTRKKKNKFYTTTKTLGKYTLLSDNQKPTIKLYSFKNNQWISNYNFLKVKIYDTQTGIKSYRATIDGEWILMEYNLKKNLLTYNFSDKKLKGSKHIFKIIVSDQLGNTNSLSASFYRKDKSK